LDALRACGVPLRRAVLIGGGARSAAVQRIAPDVLGLPVVVPSPAEYVADGAARQAAWALAGGDTPPEWRRSEPDTLAEPGDAGITESVREAYASARDGLLNSL
jgi:xylulokinase